jgi:MFS family permease
VFATTADGWFMWTLAMTAALEGMFSLISQVLLSAFAPKDMRGSFSGVYNLYGSLGFIFASQVGGYLFDNLSYTAPYMLFVGLDLIVLILTIGLLIAGYGLESPAKQPKGTKIGGETSRLSIQAGKAV